MRWATRAGIHIDRAACAWLVRRRIDPEAEFILVADPADLDDQRYDAPEARGLDLALRGLAMIRGDQDILAITGPVFDGIYRFCRHVMLLGREPT